MVVLQLITHAKYFFLIDHCYLLIIIDSVSQMSLESLDEPSD